LPGVDSLRAKPSFGVIPICLDDGRVAPMRDTRLTLLATWREAEGFTLLWQLFGRRDEDGRTSEGVNIATLP